MLAWACACHSAPTENQTPPTTTNATTTHQPRYSKLRRPIEQTGACTVSEVVACVARYSRSTLTPDDVARFVTKGLEECFARKDPRKLEQQGACLPLSLGVDARNGRVVELSYLCSDVCPDYGIVSVRYAKTSREECCEVGGYPARDGMDGPPGCSPPEVPQPKFLFSRKPGGPMELATRPPCSDEPKILFEDGTVIDDWLYLERKHERGGKRLR